MQRGAIQLQIRDLLARAFDSDDLEVLDLSGDRPADALDGQPWLDVKYGKASPENWTGVVPATVTYIRHPVEDPETLELIVKINPARGIGETLIPWIIETKGIELERPYSEYQASAEAIDTAQREADAYLLASSEPSLAAVMPRFYGTVTDSETGEIGVVLEKVAPIRCLDASGALSSWPAGDIDNALRAAARFHAAFWNAAPGWCGFRPTTDTMTDDASLWSGLLEDSHKRFPEAITTAAYRRRSRLIETIDQWHPAKDAFSTSLAHNDFNQRNVGFRGDTGQPLVLGWGLSRCDTPQRDVVELLTFLVNSDMTRREIDGHLAVHREAIQDAGVDIGSDEYLTAFRAELFVESIDRVAMQAVFSAAFDLPYLARINAAIEHLIDLYW